jgi:hypothetical protein
MAPDDARGGRSSFDDDLRDLTDEQRARAAAEARRRQHWLHQQAAEEGSFRGVLLDLGERRLLVAVATRSGRTVRGTIVRIGRDYVGLQAPEGERALLPLEAITAVRPQPGSGPPTLGDRAVVVSTSLAAVLGELVAERPRLSVHTATGDGIAGELRSTGRDLLVLRDDGGEVVYVPLGAVTDVSIT